MKIELNLKDMLSLYLAAYIFRRKGPPEAKEMLDEALDKVREQLARSNEAQLVEMELFADACMEADARALQGPAH